MYQIDEYNNILGAYNEICKALRRIRQISTKRKQAIDAVRKHYEVDEIIKAFEITQANPYLCGNGDSDWKADFDWIIKPENLEKILGGFYDRKPRNQENPLLKTPGKFECIAIQQIVKEVNNGNEVIDGQ